MIMKLIRKYFDPWDESSFKVCDQRHEMEEVSIWFAEKLSPPTIKITPSELKKTIPVILCCVCSIVRRLCVIKRLPSLTLFRDCKNVINARKYRLLSSFYWLCYLFSFNISHVYFWKVQIICSNNVSKMELKTKNITVVLILGIP